MTATKYNNSPFELFNYSGPEYFCDRREELDELIKAFDSKTNTVLSSFRRLGKTSLISHMHYYLAMRKDVITIYVDVLNTKSDGEFINAFITSVLQSLERVEPQVVKFLKALGNVKPQASIDPITGMPTLSVDIQNKKQVGQTFGTVMTMLMARSEKIQITIDEFQQIENYKETTAMDATIRSYFQKAQNLHFIFSGSDQHLLAMLFSSPKKPMFSSTQMINLDYIPYDAYFDFIKLHFKNAGKVISDTLVDDILTWTKRYTFYTHFLCNNLFTNTQQKVEDVDLAKAMNRCIKYFEGAYYFFEKTLSKNQFLLLRAIGKEEIAVNIFGKEFLSRYKFSSSSAKLALNTLIKEQLVHEQYGENGSEYFVYDVFLMRWLQLK